MKTYGDKFRPICKLAGGIVLSVNRQSNMPTGFAKKWTGGGCGLLQSIGIASICSANILTDPAPTSAVPNAGLSALN